MTAMSLIKAADRDGNADVENGLDTLVMSLILSAVNDGNEVLRVSYKD